MTISFTLEQLALLNGQVARGGFSTIGDAARQMIDERIAEREAEAQDDLVWTKPQADEALVA